MLSTATLIFSLGLLAPLLPSVHAHGQVSGVMANGQYNAGPNIYYDGDSKNKQTAIRKMFPASSPAYLNYWDFNDNSKMSCEGAGPAPKTVKVSAGSQLHIYWQGATSELLNKPGTGNTQGNNPWVHAMGSVTDYITSCNGDCSSFDATNAGWVKIAEFGLDKSQSISSELRNAMAGKPEPYYPQGQGLWGMAKMVQESSTWVVTIPQALQNGQYLVRNELAAVHSPKGSGGGPQLYVACIQVEVVDGGSESLPSGTQAGQLYETDGYLANFDVYSAAGKTFKEIGPKLWSVVTGGSSSSSDSGSSSGSSNSGSGSGSGSSSSSDSGSSSGSSNSGSSSGSGSSSSDSSSGSGSSSSSSASSSGSSGSISGSGSGSIDTGNNYVDNGSSTPSNEEPVPSSSSSTPATPVSTQRCKARKRSVPGLSKRSLGGHRDMIRKRRLEH